MNHLGANEMLDLTSAGDPRCHQHGRGVFVLSRAEQLGLSEGVGDSLVFADITKRTGYAAAAIGAHHPFRRLNVYQINFSAN